MGMFELHAHEDVGMAPSTGRASHACEKGRHGRAGLPLTTAEQPQPLPENSGPRSVPFAATSLQQLGEPQGEWVSLKGHLSVFKDGYSAEGGTEVVIVENQNVREFANRGL